jgi:hypothetical protein
MYQVRDSKKGAVKRLNEIISPILRESGLEEGVRLHLLKRKWKELFREPLSLHLYPSRLSGEELLVNVDSPVWLQEVSLHKEEILKVLEPFRIKEIRFRMGRVFHDKQKTANVSKVHKKPLSPQSISFIEEAIESIEDDELRAAIRATMERSLRD